MRWQRAAPAVEFALFPLLLAFIIAVAEYGIFFFIAYETEQVAYQAAKTGSVAQIDRSAIATAEANRLITELGLSGYEPAIKVTVNPGESTTVRISFHYTTVTGISEIPVVGILFPSSIDKTASHKNIGDSLLPAPPPEKGR
ncbi:MAG: pilus assembly protein [Nitrospirales bacterium]|nr:pilus assembly protein [Nitrospirales bacterium]